MKIRISKGSLRFRLTPADLENLLTQMSLAEELQLSECLRLSFRLSLRQNSTQAVLETQSKAQQQTLIEVFLPESQYRQWAFDKNLLEWPTLEPQQGPKIFIEKDLKPNRS